MWHLYLTISAPIRKRLYFVIRTFDNENKGINFHPHLYHYLEVMRDDWQ